MNRATLIKLVHAGARKLFKDDDMRRDWQRQRTGHESCSDMSDADLENLVAELRRKGALAPRRAPKRAGRVPFNRSTYMEKIEAQLADMGLSWQYAESIAYKITGGKGGRFNSPNRKPGEEVSRPGVRRLEWVHKPEHFRAIIAALAVEQKKRGGQSRIDELLKQLGKDRAYIDTLVPFQIRGRWHRNSQWMSAIIDTLHQELEALQEEQS